MSLAAGVSDSVSISGIRMTNRALWCRVCSVASTLVLVACSSTTTPVQSLIDAQYAHDVRVRDCNGPALSLPSALRAQLQPRTGMMQPDDHWADLAEKIPGGFAGVLLIDGQPSMWLVHPEQEAAAKAALLTDPSFGNFDFRRAQVLQARWDFAQLVDWYNYLMTTGIWTNSGLVSGDKDERINRIRYGVKDEASQQELVRRLEALDVPCNLIQVGLESPPVTL